MVDIAMRGDLGHDEAHKCVEVAVFQMDLRAITAADSSATDPPAGNETGSGGGL